MAETGHVEQVLDIAVQSLGLVAGAFQQFATIRRRDRLAQRQQAVDGAAHGRQRRAQVVGDRGEQGAAQLLGFAVQARGLQVLGQASPRQGLGQGLAEGGEQAPALRAQRLAVKRRDTEQCNSVVAGCMPAYEIRFFLA